MRVSDSEGHVIGVDLSGSKNGGMVEDAVLLIPDPMGATGSTILRAVRHYIEHHGTPAKIIAMPVIVTPEYLRAVLQEIDGIQIYAGRLDRGLSTENVLASTPGTHWERELRSHLTCRVLAHGLARFHCFHPHHRRRGGEAAVHDALTSPAPLSRWWLDGGR